MLRLEPRCYTGRKMTHPVRLEPILLAASLVLTSCLAPPAAAPANHAQILAAQDKPATLEGYVVQIDGQYSTIGAGPVPLSLGCHVVVSASGYGNLYSYRRDLGGVNYGHPRVLVTRYFKFTAKAGHHYVIERDYRYSSSLPSARAGGGATANRMEVRTLAERNEEGALERRYFESEASEAPLSC